LLPSGLAPPSSLESAILTTLSPGNYTAIVRGKQHNRIALVEAYDLDPISTREVWSLSAPTARQVRAQRAILMMAARWPSSIVNGVIRAVTTIPLGPGTFRTSASDQNHKWQVKSGWVVEGAGMDSTTVQMGGSVAGIHYDLEAFKSVQDGSSTDNVIIQDLTVDCNWAELSTTADTGAGWRERYLRLCRLLSGSNNLIERVRHTNTYGSFCERTRGIWRCPYAPSNMDATGNRISYCEQNSLPEITGQHLA